MAIKPFAIQGADLTLGGVNLQAGTTGVVIPGVTQAVDYFVEDVNDTDVDQNVQFVQLSIVIDAVTYNALLTSASTASYSTYTVELDDDNYIDEITVASRGIYTQQEKTTNETTDMWAYTGLVDPFATLFDEADWLQIPFRPKMRAGEIENVGGGGGIGNLSIGDNDETILSDDGNKFVNFNGINNGLILGTINNKNVIVSLDDGGSNWEFATDGSLTFPDGTTQTTAYTGQSGGGSTSTLYVAVNSDGRSFTSSDGISWTEYTTNMLGVGRVAVGPDTIVYTANADDVSNGNDDALWYASTDTPGTVTEVTGFSNFSLTQVKYFANIQKFVAVGNNTDNLPVILYSSNGTSWTQVDLDSGFLAAFDSGAGFQGNAEFTDIETNGTGFLLTTSNNNLGAFYTTDITTPMGQNSWIDFSGFGLEYEFRRIAYAAAGEYTGWHIMQNESDTDDAWYYNNNIDPTYGGFSPFALNNIGNEFAAEVNYEPAVSEVVFGAYNGITTIMVATRDGQILYWPAVSAGPWVSIPKPYTATDFDITQSSTATITFGGYSANTNEKIVLSNCTPSDYNGTYYVDNNNFLYTNADMGTAFDSSGLGSFESGTLTFSHGQYLDALHYSNGKFYAGNDDEEMFVSTDGGATWTLSDTFTGSPGEPEYMNDIDSYITTTSSSLTNGSYSFTLNSDGTIALPAIEMTAYEPGYTIDGPTLQMGNDPTVSEVIITGPAPDGDNRDSRRLIIQGQRGFGGWSDPYAGEGGDIYLWAGTGGESDSGTNPGNGGDIKIRGGVGQAGTLGGNTTEGGYVKIEGGDVKYGYGTGGFVEINAGSINQGNGGLGDGGDVTIRAGLGSVNNGEVHIHTSSNGDTYDNEWVFKNDGTLQLPSGDSINGSELIGNGSDAGTGFTRIVYTDWNGGQGGESMSMGGEDWFAASDITGVEIGDTITFQQGEVRTISGITVDGSHAVVTWSGGTVTGSTTLPRYPVTITTSDYVEPAKNTARIKPDSTAATDYGQYVDVYAGGISQVIDSKHIHMAGHTGEIELFLGSDNNYVSAKEAGTAPAGVRLHSENDVSVESSNLRINRKGSSWAAVYGDGKNYNQEVHNNDLSFGPIAVDEHGDYYVGGEHCWTADAIISKYGRDGNLIWSKYNSGPDVVGWDVKAIAYHNGEVATVTATNQGRTENYIKLTVQDSTTGEIKSTRDLYDTDGSVSARSMCYHSTLGWVVAGRTWGETATSGTKSAGSGSGVGVIEVPLIGIQFDGTYPKLDTDWYVTGTGITGRQYLTNGTGRYSDLPITSVTGGGSSATARVTVDYNTGAYSTLTVQNQGGGYNSNDELKIPGSLLGGVDAMTSVTATPFSVNPGTNIMVQFDQTTYPDLYDQLKWASYTVSYNAGTHNVLNIVDSGDGYWNVTIEGSDTNLSVATFYTANGNDLTFLAQVSGDLLVGPNSALTGVASRKTLRLEMSNMGYGSTDFTGASFTFSRYLNSQPWVWTSSWTRYLNQAGDADTMTSGNAYTVVEDTYSGGVYVGGYIVDASNHSSFVWKLTASGTTSWVEALGIDTGGVVSIAVSTVDGSVYATSESIGTSSINKLDTNGALLIRKSPDGMWGVDAHVKLEIGLDGLEYVYVGGQGGAVWIGPTYALLVNKFTSALDPIWGREMYYQGGEGLYTNYNDTYNNFVLGKGQASVVGFTDMFGADQSNAAIFTIDTTDEFVPVSDNNWVLGTNTQLAWALDTSTTIVDLLAAGVEAETSSVLSDAGGLALALIEWTFQERVINLNNTANGIVGVETIDFASGGVLDHNPSDIPPSVGFDSQSGWNYTLQLSDRGRFIINQPVPNDSYAENLYITVPRNDNVSFPVGTVITLINSSSAEAGGYIIAITPEGFGDPNAPQIWATGYQNPSSWSFQGIQTATLMKISSNGWLLTANNINNTD